MNMNVNHDSEVLHLTEPMVLDLIKKVEESITRIATHMDDRKANLMAAEEMYLPLKQEWDNLQAQLDKEKILLQTLVGFKDNKNIRKNVKVHRSISNGQPKKHKNPRLPITIEASRVLYREGSFMRRGRLVSKMFEANPDWNKDWMSKVETNLLQVTKRSVKKVLVIHNDKFGLPDWLDENDVPKSKFLNSLIHE